MVEVGVSGGSGGNGGGVWVGGGVEGEEETQCSKTFYIFFYDNI